MSPRRDDPDGALMVRVEARDADALAELYDRHAARLLGLARRILGEGGEAEEVLQEVFLFAWRAAASFDPTRGSVLTWLLIATRSRAIDRVRSRSSSSRPEARRLDDLSLEPAAPVDVEAASAERQWEAVCRSAVGELPGDQRKVLELAYFEGLTQQEIAERTATPLGTVKTRARLGLMKLRERLRPYLGSGSRVS
ncbi:MAG TPA: sigma-70 family RNA polymerase sigma factor [Thermoanaerobaculia bacterium]|nr:sigma-70 family RNA polymerase sigma factor [Thermoanaerobaculia bacterium]